MRLFWLVIGLVSTGFGVMGAILPLVPGTPFLLVACFAFARSSPQLHSWLTGHRHFGPVISNWTERGAISRGAKILAVLSLIITLCLSIALGVPGWVIAIQALALAGVAAFILTRPDGTVSG